MSSSISVFKTSSPDSCSPSSISVLSSSPSLVTFMINPNSPTSGNPNTVISYFPINFVTSSKLVSTWISFTVDPVSVTDIKIPHEENVSIRANSKILFFIFKYIKIYIPIKYWNLIKNWDLFILKGLKSSGSKLKSLMEFWIPPI